MNKLTVADELAYKALPDEVQNLVQRLVDNGYFGEVDDTKIEALEDNISDLERVIGKLEEKIAELEDRMEEEYDRGFSDGVESVES